MFGQTVAAIGHEENESSDSGGKDTSQTNEICLALFSVNIFRFKR